MAVSRRLSVLAAGAASIVTLAGLSAGAQSYFHAPSGGPPAYTTWPSTRTQARSTYIGAPYAGASYGHVPYGTMPYAGAYGAPAVGMPATGTPFGPPDPFGGVSPGYGVTPGMGATFTRPRGRLSYDVYTPYGKMEYHYRFRRNGTVKLDIDD